MPRITISYRRDDSLDITGRIFDRLAAHFGPDALFRDIDNIPPGSDFRKHIDVMLDQSDIILAIVGPRWIGPRTSRNRLANAADPVRLEIETALRRNKLLIPVLVSRAQMPQPEQLPETIRDFAYRHAVQVDSGQDFEVHISRLIRALDRILEARSGESSADDPVAGSIAKHTAEPEETFEYLLQPTKEVDTMTGESTGGETGRSAEPVQNPSMTLDSPPPAAPEQEAVRRGDEEYKHSNYSEAMKWYRVAADQRHPIGQFNLGLLFEFGNGVEKDLAEARHWYHLAAEQGDEGAKTALARLSRKYPNTG